MQIGEVAQKTQLSLRTIRHYDEIGLLSPSARSEGGFRLYTNDDLETLLLIRRIRPLEFTLQEMKELLDLIAESQAGRSSTASRARLAEFRAQAVERRAKLADYLSRVDEIIDLIG